MRQLVMTAAPWRRALEGLLRPGDQLAVGPCGVHRTRACERVLVRGLEVLPPGAVRDRLSRWRDLVVVAAFRGRGFDPAALARSLGPSSIHRLSVLALGAPEAAGLATGWTLDGGSWVSIDELLVLGRFPAALPLAVEPSPAPPLDDLTAERWSRTIGALTLPAWQRLHAARIALVGAGRSGSLAAHLLALQGACRELVLLDGDILELGNLDAVHGVRPSDVGRPKVEAVARGLRSVRPDLEVRAERLWAQDGRALPLLRGSDVLITTVDRDAARLAAARAASAYLRGHLDIGTGIARSGDSRRVGADVRLLLPGEGCVSCVGGLGDERAAHRELALAPPELDSERSASDWRAERAGSLATVNAAAVGAGVQLLFDYFEGRVGASRWLRLEWDEEGRMAARDMPAAPRRGCAVCAMAGLGDYALGDFA